MKTCDVKWCACLPVDGSTVCAAHKVEPAEKPKGFLPGDPRAKEAGLKGGRIRGDQRQEESLVRWLKLYPDLNPATAKEIYKAGYNAGHAAGLRPTKLRVAQAMRGGQP